MLEYTRFITNKGLAGIIQRTFNQVDSRLIDHGKRVAYLVWKMIEEMGGYDSKQKRDICLAAILHDIGAYKTEEINHMLEFESGNVWEHSVYGYLFLKYFSPLAPLSPIILYHHADWSLLKECEEMDDECRKLAQIICLADRMDVFLNAMGKSFKEFMVYLCKAEGKKFSPEVIMLLTSSKIRYLSAAQIDQDEEFMRVLCEIPFTETEIDSYLKMLILAIDFRSTHTVTHTLTTTSISRETARLIGVSKNEENNIVCGAMLHDLGKIGIPVEILEYPGKLSTQAMKIMRTHVDLTEEIMGTDVGDTVKLIALRHHEKLDGSGYPKGLAAKDMTVAQRIVAVADIVSALCGTRSYKDAYPNEKVIGIIQKMSEDGLIDPDIVHTIVEHLDDILMKTREQTRPVMEIYRVINEEYKTLIEKMTEKKIRHRGSE